MSMMKQSWEDAIRSSNEPRRMFEAFMDAASMPGNQLYPKPWISEYWTYLPPDSSPEEIDQAERNLNHSLYVDDQINHEHAYATMLWPRDYDDTHSDMEWQHLIAGQLHKPGVEFRERMVKLAALAKSAIMSYDRKYLEGVEAERLCPALGTGR